VEIRKIGVQFHGFGEIAMAAGIRALRAWPFQQQTGLRRVAIAQDPIDDQLPAIDLLIAQQAMPSR